MFNAGGVHKNKICSVIIIISYYYLHWNGWKGLADGDKLCIAHCYWKFVFKDLWEVLVYRQLSQLCG